MRIEELSVVGKSLPRVDSREKATGEAIFGVDITLSGMLWGRILRSPHPHARILNIDTTKAKRLPGVRAVITGDDTPGIKYGILPPFADKFPLAIDKVRYIGDEIAAVAAVDLETADEAIDLISVDYEPLPAVFDPEEAMKPEAPQVHEGIERNVAFTLNTQRGEIEKGFREAHCIFEDSFSTHSVQHCTLEPHVCVAKFDSKGRLTVWSSTQSPYILRSQLSHTLKIPLSNVRVIKPHVGGGFGSKIHMLSLDFCCALLSWKSGRPVKIIYTRKEEFTSSPIRHPMLIKIKTGVKKDGTLIARQARVVLDNGAYNSSGPAVLAFSDICFESLYRTPHLRYEGYLVYTNKHFGGAMRGFGNPQITFALESQIDMIADHLGMDPIELRLKNVVKAGDITPCGLKITSCGLAESIIKAAEQVRWKQKRGKKGNRGVGMACMIHTISARAIADCDASAAFIKVHDDGTMSVLSGASDIGQGSDTVLAQIVAEELGVRLEDVRMIPPDTEISPMDMGTYATRVTFIAGNAVRTAARDAKRQLLQVASEMLEANPEDLVVRGGEIFVKGAPQKAIPISQVVMKALYSSGATPILGRGYYDPPTQMTDHKTGVGNISPSYVFGTQIAEVEVDTKTGKVKVVKFTAANDIGKAINPMATEGQIEGGVVQGIGYALTESFLYEGGRVSNYRFRDYRIPSALDVSKVDSILIETIDPEGPFGAKGVGEPGSVPTAPAIANAIYDAVGVRIKDLPITPEKILAQLKEINRKVRSSRQSKHSQSEFDTEFF